ncbi:DNA alkylation repair protein [Leucobacter sp. cx-42]|uniref:DNA alkylation repair protein n=1 Tax=unclassified Leucobacter TaxID=2621730 RepID=UPI00165D8D7C|nr:MULTISPECIES: DNA alkylation repair protein [unclassified Leucobacter]MBC9953342.1 DNA alkylation repair protein [Leucobacter sp. cx-42]
MASPGASKKSDVTAEHLAALNTGKAEARTLTEALVIDHPALLAAAVPDAPSELVFAAEAAQSLGILKRMTAIGQALHEHLGADHIHALTQHRSDTVRGWTCFAIAADSSHSVASLLDAVKPLADDHLFTVREWVWMAVRPRMAEELELSIHELTPWTGEPSANLRRFASESLRPRGVWAKHIAEFKSSPQFGEPLLEPLRSDPHRYVQDSVANWINDAAKDSPEWARAICERWNAESPTAATAYITKRALRSLK